MWSVSLTSRTDKELRKLPESIQAQFASLIKEMEIQGPLRKNWKNFGALSDYSYHCHIKRGRPTYVVCWRVLNKQERTIEVFYVGTHEKAPY